VRPRLRALALGIACVAGAAGCASDKPEVVTGGTTRAPDGRFFAPTSVWNRPLGPGARIAPDSRLMVRELRHQVDSSAAWINTDKFSVPIVTVGARQRPVRVHLDTTFPHLQRGFARVPVPAGAHPAGGSDEHLVVWQPSSDTMWEFWLMQRKGDGWHARWGARIDHASRSPGIVRAPEGATASGLPLAAGLMTTDELRSGRIDHALAFALPAVREGVMAWPADRTDGKAHGPGAIPMGTRFRLDPKVDVDRLDLPPAGRAIARAVQRYGMIARDTSGAVNFYAQAPPPGGDDPYGQIFDGKSPDQLLANFPWDRLQVVRAPLRRSG
jgi:hypothetical protein